MSSFEKKIVDEFINSIVLSRGGYNKAAKSIFDYAVFLVENKEGLEKIKKY